MLPTYPAVTHRKTGLPFVEPVAILVKRETWASTNTYQLTFEHKKSIKGAAASVNDQSDIFFTRRSPTIDDVYASADAGLLHTLTQTVVCVCVL